MGYPRPLLSASPVRQCQVSYLASFYGPKLKFLDETEETASQELVHHGLRKLVLGGHSVYIDHHTGRNVAELLVQAGGHSCRLDTVIDFALAATPHRNPDRIADCSHTPPADIHCTSDHHGSGNQAHWNIVLDRIRRVPGMPEVPFGAAPVGICLGPGYRPL